MKIGVISDTHDNLFKITKALEVFKQEGIRHILHAGDVCSPFSIAEIKKAGIPITAVFGNNDGDWLLLTKVMGDGGEIKKGPFAIELADRKIALMHEPVFIDALADSGHFDLVIYGHTHGSEVRSTGKALVLNPGECSGYVGGKNSAAVCDLDTMEARIVDLEG